MSSNCFRGLLLTDLAVSALGMMGCGNKTSNQPAEKADTRLALTRTKEATTNHTNKTNKRQRKNGYSEWISLTAFNFIFVLYSFYSCDSWWLL